jgi:hypothetical protein
MIRELEISGGIEISAAEATMVRECEIPTSEMFPKAVHVHLNEADLSFDVARRAAYERARTYCTDPMLLSWFDRKAGNYSPGNVECCKEGKPSWVAYAEGRGADLTIDINHEDYIFMFRESEGLF